MPISALARFLSLALFGLWGVEAFVATGIAVSGSSSGLLLTQQQHTSTSSVAKKAITGFVRARAPLAPVPRMSSYEGGAMESSGETQYEMQELIVDFTDDGRILLEVKGVKGPECKQITEELIKALGDVIHTENTAEYFEEKVVNIQQEKVQVGWSYDASKPEW